GFQALAFASGVATVAAVGLLARTGAGPRRELHVLVLTGVVVGALASAGTSLLKVLADPYNQLPTITFWLLGSLAAVRPLDVVALLPAVALGLGILALLRWRLDLLTLDDDEARALGTHIIRLRAAVVAAATLMTAATVSLAGNIGWIGLVVPHLARMVAGPTSSRLLPAAALLGGAFLLVVDTGARSLAGQELPLGIVMALVGAPFFLVLLRRTSGGWR
ncbi:MAG: iron ABC transporter permease, partial [Deltaproteobacteria bacterium]|nr:iron ABC transporter permease [Deltaproteobacteria bacterium]